MMSSPNEISATPLAYLTTDVNDNITNTKSVDYITIQPTILVKDALLIILGTGLFSVVVAYGFKFLRKHVYHDSQNVDTTFDAGGKVSIGMTATTIVSQATWVATFLMSCTVSAKFGINGAYWYAAGATVQFVMFAILSIQLKTRAPGAKTFLQVIMARFGKPTHIIYCSLAIFTHIMVAIMLLLSGTEVITSLVQGMTFELTAMVLAAVIGSYTLIGGLGATFYVSYFNSSLVFIALIYVVVEVFHNPSNRPTNELGSVEIVYNLLNVTKGPEGNEGLSYLTFNSANGLMFGIIMVIFCTVSCFCDQSYWQSSVAAHPIDGVWGFITGGLVWFAIPFVFATTVGLSYLALQTNRGTPLLSPEDVDKGLIAPVVSQILLGKTGEYMIFLFMIMAIMSTGSAEVIAVASIVVYDIYQIYIHPFRTNAPALGCIICGKEKADITLDETYELVPNNEVKVNYCKCVPMIECRQCRQWEQEIKENKHPEVRVKPPYTCAVHGLYRRYQDSLMNFKNWCILWITLLTIPIILVAKIIGINLSWAFYFMGVVGGCAIVPLWLSICWMRVTAWGMISGAVCGCSTAIASWLAVTSTYEGGLSNFIANTSREVPALVGNCVAFGVSAIVCVIVSLFTIDKKRHSDKVELEKMRNIENPLYPWSYKYAKDFGARNDQGHFTRPSQEMMVKVFRRARIVSIVVCILLTVGLLFIWPGIMSALRVLNEWQFRSWVIFSEVYGFIAAAFIIIVPLVQEVYGIWKKVKENREQQALQGPGIFVPA